MLGIGFGELMVIAVVLLIAVGPKSMPKLAKTLGTGLREFRRATRELRNSVGLDEILRDDELAQLRRPLDAPMPGRYRPAPPPAAPEQDATPDGVPAAGPHDAVEAQDAPVSAPRQGAVAPGEAFGDFGKVSAPWDAAEPEAADAQQIEAQADNKAQADDKADKA